MTAFWVAYVLVGLTLGRFAAVEILRNWSDEWPEFQLEGADYAAALSWWLVVGVSWPLALPAWLAYRHLTKTVDSQEPRT